MKQVRLVQIDASLLQALAEPARFEQLVGGKLEDLAEVLRPILEQTLRWHAAKPRAAAWGSFLAVDDTVGKIVGTGGYKDGPAADGEVEIAYGTFPPYEGQGYATSIAAELLARAKNSPEVGRVSAHTLPQRNASCRVLEKIGLRWVGEVMDPEDGRVWRWETVVGASEAILGGQK